MKLQKWKHLCRMAWAIDYKFLRKDRFARIGERRHNTRNSNKTTDIECNPQKKPF